MNPTDESGKPDEVEQSGQPIHIAVESDDIAEANPVGDVIQPQANTSTPEAEEVFVAPAHGTTIEIEPSLEDPEDPEDIENVDEQSPENPIVEPEPSFTPDSPEEAPAPFEPEPITSPVSPAPIDVTTPEDNTANIDAGVAAGSPPETAKPLFSPDNPAQIPPVAPVVPSKGKKKKILVIIAGVLAGLLVLGGGLAAAYFAVYLPNTPENVLRAGIANTVQQKHISASGEFDFKPIDAKKEGAMDAFKVTFDTKNNIEKKQSEIKLKYTAAGIDFPVEARYVDDAAYVKIGDLSTLVSMARGFAASAGVDISVYEPLIKDVSSLLSDQWIEFDSTLLDSANLSCTLDTDVVFTDSDVKLLDELFAEKPFGKIDSHSNDTVNGKSAIKYQISIDDNKLAKFLEDKKLEQLSIVKALDKCADPDDGTLLDTEELADDDTTPITLWVDKDAKRIVKVAAHSTEQDAKEENFEGTIQATLAYDTVSVSKPEDAKPAMEIWGQLQEKLAPIFGTMFSAGIDGMTDDIDGDPTEEDLDIDDIDFEDGDFEDFEIQ